MQLMLQATVCDCLALDPFAFEEDGLSAPEVDVSRGKIVEALVIAGMVVVRHEGGDLAFEIAGQVVVLKQDAVLERLMPALDLALGLRMEGGSADMTHAVILEPGREIPGDVAGSVVAQQPRPMRDPGGIAAGSLQCLFEGFGDILAALSAVSIRETDGAG